jgi:hypothetical protein
MPHLIAAHLIAAHLIAAHLIAAHLIAAQIALPSQVFNVRFTLSGDKRPYETLFNIALDIGQARTVPSSLWLKDVKLCVMINVRYDHKFYR